MCYSFFFVDYEIYTSQIDLVKGDNGVLLEATLDDFRNKEGVESFVLELDSGVDILPPNIGFGTTVISIINVGE